MNALPNQSGQLSYRLVLKHLIGTQFQSSQTASAHDLQADDRIAAQLKETSRLLDLSRLRHAQVAFDNNLVELARNTLDEVAPENRCLAWGLLNRRLEGSLFTLRGHAGGVSGVAVTAVCVTSGRLQRR